MYMTSLLTEHVPQHHLRAVLTSVTTGERPLVWQWADGGGFMGSDEDDDGGKCPDNGCPGVKMAYAMANRPIDADEVHSQGSNANIERFLAGMCEGITAHMIGVAWRSWDYGTEAERDECLAACKAKLDSLPRQYDDEDRLNELEAARLVGVRPLTAKLGSMVGAATLVLAAVIAGV